MAYRKSEGAPLRKRGRKSKYLHLLRAMRAGDVLYLPENLPRMDKAITATVFRYGGKAETACFVSTNLDPLTAHRVVRVKIFKPLRAKG